MLTYLETWWLSLEIGHTDLFGFPRICSLIWTQKSTPSHGNCIPLPTPFAESEVGNFHHLYGLENKFIGLEYKLPYMVCHVLLKVKDGHLTILTDSPFLSFWPELPNCSHLASVMVCVTIKHLEIYFEKKKKEAGMEPYTVTIVGTG